MKPHLGWHNQYALYALVAAVSLALAGCGGGSGSSSNPAPSTINNTQAVAVNSGPANNYINGLFTDVTICVPGSTSNCQTISNVLVDTGSEGLRLLSSQVTLSLPPVIDNSSNGLQECVGFADGSYVWGPVVGADIQMAGEKASSVPMQLISSSSTYAVPSQCTSGGGPNENTVQLLGANGILGIGNFQQDCGAACTSASTAPPLYYLCPNSVCGLALVPLNFQLQNPVWMFPQDNNGVLISLPSILAGGAPAASGSLIFGIGTQSDNALGSAQVYTTDASGNFQTTYNNIAYSQSYIDSGSNAFYFLDHATLGIPDCSDAPGFYCPGSTVNYTVTNTGQNGTTGPVSFSIANADSLFNSNGGANWAFNNLGGDTGTSPSTDSVDFGLPFFFGRNVFVGIENETGPNGVVGPYWAY
ncbi:MAG TPA: DUF3443 domain-containing protein [Terriglobia bacterium]|nr:DUF3443 domain-containing protein [Terriglobia bacterium]